jgi:hypothetical protein
MGAASQATLDRLRPARLPRALAIALKTARLPGHPAPSVIQNYSLTADGITVTVELGTPELSQAPLSAPMAFERAVALPFIMKPLRFVFARSRMGLREVPTTPPVSLSADGISATPVLGTPAITQGHSLAATGPIATPVLGTPALTQTHALSADGITTTPVLGTPILTSGGVDALTADGITTSPVLGTPAIQQAHTLAADGIATTPVLAGAVFNQICALVADGVATGLPSLGAPALAQIHQLVATGIIAGPPELGTPSLDFVFTINGYLRLITPAVLYQPIDGRATIVHAEPTTAESEKLVYTEAEQARYLQCPPVGGKAW